MKSHVSQLNFKWKTEDVTGLQLADLVAYPLTRHVLNPKAVNPAYRIFEPNIFASEGKLKGIKIFPQP